MIFGTSLFIAQTTEIEAAAVRTKVEIQILHHYRKTSDLSMFLGLNRLHRRSSSREAHSL